MASRITGEGQVTIPQDILETLGVGPGGEVDFKRAANGRVVVEKVHPSRPESDWDKARGSADAGLSSDQLMKLLRSDD